VHVLARAITDAATSAKVKVVRAKHVHEQVGHGLKAMLHGKEVLVGQRSLLVDNQVEIPASVKSKQTTTFVSVNGTLAGYITFKDELRPETKPTLMRLRKFGIQHMLMITGDSRVTAEAIAKPLGITDIKAEALPADKLYALESLTDRPVAFVGDGVNDAPVLTAADVGIALGARGSTAASESADVVILRDDISLLAQAVDIARRTFRIAKQSIVIGIAISLGLMLAFSTGRFSPLLGAILQEVVDVIVILNALRAHYGRP
jgi:P-type E1-E2 ATPase